MDRLKMNSIEQRLERLEKNIRRRQRLGLLLAIVGFGVISIAAQGDRVNDVISTRSLRIVDKDGKTVVGLSTDVNNRPMMDFFDQNGKRRIFIGFLGGGAHPGLALTDAQGDERITMMVDSKVGPSMAFLDKGGRLRMIHFSGSDGPTGMGIFTPEGKQVMRIGINPGSSTEFVILNNEEKERFRAP